MLKLTRAQERILDEVVAFQNRKGYPPTLKELGAQVGIKTRRGVSIHLDALERKGFVIRGSSARAIKVLKEAKETSNEEVVSLPLIGRIAAGNPILATQDTEGYFPVQKWLVGKRRDCFLLRVKGDSMDKSHILDKDLIVVQPQNTADLGDIVVALIRDEATVKRMTKINGEIFLNPESNNINHKPIKISDDVSIQGKVIGVIRDLQEVTQNG